MIVLNKPKIYSLEPSANSAVLSYGELYQTKGKLNHDIPGIIFETSDLRNSTIFTKMGESTELSFATRKTINKVKAYSELENNWDGHGADKPGLNVINNVISFLRKADEDGLEIYFIAPGPNGEILVEFKEGDREAEIYFNSDNTNQLLIYEGEDCLVEGTLEENYKLLAEMISSYAGV